MKTKRCLAFALLVAMLLPLVVYPALAQESRCQCSYTDWIRDCKATLSKADKWIRITSDTQQCSRVDWVAEGQPQVTIVTGGVETQEWLGQNQSPAMVVQSCKVCKDAFTSAQDGIPPALAEGVVEVPTPISPFHGRWVGAIRNPFGISKRTEIEIVSDGSKVSGWIHYEGSPQLTFLEVRETSSSLVFVVRIDANVTHTMTLSGPSGANIIAKAGFLTARGEFQRQ